MDGMELATGACLTITPCFDSFTEVHDAFHSMAAILAQNTPFSLPAMFPYLRVVMQP